jgi:PPK2 family polyphosphate:nucleotide phosphotransferase
MDLKKLSSKLMIKPGKKVRLDKIKTGDTNGFNNRDQAEKVLEKNRKRMAELQYLLYAQNKYGLLIVLQGMDACGKDGTVRQVMRGVNPQGCKIVSYKAPNSVELDHDYLWRIHHNVPPLGEIGIFNRSHYEDVLIVRVRNLVPKQVWSDRYDQINEFENILARNNYVILKFFLHISKKEQKERLEARLQDPTKNWKMNPEDLKEREKWNDYQKAYESVLSKCSTKWAPWYVIPADKKWFRNLAISQIIVETLEGLNMKFPKPDFDPKKIVVK